MSLSDDIKQLTGLCIVGSRQSGKTMQLIKLSEETGIPIITSNVTMRNFIKDMATRAGYDIPAPLVLRDASRLPRQQSGYRPQPVLVDDVHKFFDRCGLRPVVMTLPFNAVEFFFDKSVIKQANPSLFQVLRMWWRCKKEFMK